MEGQNPSKTLALKLLLFLAFLVIQAPEATKCQTLHSEPTFSQSPSPTPPSKPPKFPHNARLRRIILGALFGSVTGFVGSIAFLLFIRLLLLYACRAPILKGPVVFCPSISPKTLQLALSNDARRMQLIGSSPNGKYYRAVLDDDELAVAVKVLELSPVDGSPTASSDSHKRRVQHQLESLARVKHQNVMSLRAYIRDQDRFLLVYDYIPSGSLEDAMARVRSQQLMLGWDARHLISVGIAKGLRYLHFEFSRKILHYSLKPSNVMFDEGCEPRLGDFGLAMLANPRLDTPNTAHYVAPECFDSCSYTDKSDIYSFGMILAVLLTGKDPSDPFFTGETGKGSLARWLRHLQQAGEARDALDKGILGEELEEEEMLMAIRIAIVCLSDLPTERPSSDELVAMLTQLHSF
ncbi:inactive leucine-rich repeat receptor-like protein kinase CORYNE [Canna indica]|uniref:Inactive leucine-rich repeat receptor-like protein kinase CORYNE n=1 Tax=Canna indica TaxID=4628 RepID=A0AAQ3KWZ1_9LILI|nr:inactive leucine-rich repeat receptor-like protein kinase CORYNE [Canna indica]